MLGFHHESRSHSPARRPGGAGLRRRSRTQAETRPGPGPRARLRLEPPGPVRARWNSRNAVPNAARAGKRYCRGNWLSAPESHCSHCRQLSPGESSTRQPGLTRWQRSPTSTLCRRFAVFGYGCLDRLSNRLTKILSETRNLGTCSPYFRAGRSRQPLAIDSGLNPSRVASRESAWVSRCRRCRRAPGIAAPLLQGRIDAGNGSAHRKGVSVPTGTTFSASSSTTTWRRRGSTHGISWSGGMSRLDGLVELTLRSPLQ
jgi:hypothetical protein